MQRKVLPKDVKIFYFPEKTKWLLWDRELSNDGFTQMHTTGQN